MKKIENKKNFTVQKETEWWKEAGKVVTSFFGTNCFWIFWKYDRAKIERAFHIAEKENDHNFTHFMNNITKP